MKNKHQTVWREISTPPSTLSTEHWRWLSDQGSLTKRFQDVFSNKITFHLISEGCAELASEERQALGLSNDTHSLCWVRHIEWHFCGELWVAARTVLPYASSHPLLRKIGAASIGNSLFRAGTYQRGPIEIAELSLQDDFCRYFPVAHLLPQTKLWARRRLFYQKKEKLLVSEVFFPNFFQYNLPNA